MNISRKSIRARTSGSPKRVLSGLLAGMACLAGLAWAGASGNPAETAAYRRAAATLQPIRREPHETTDGLDSRDAGRDLYYELADLLLQNPRLSGAELGELRSLAEQAKVVELEDYYRDDCVAAWLEKASAIDRLAPRTAVLYPIVLPDRLERRRRRYPPGRRRERPLRETRHWPGRCGRPALAAWGRRFPRCRGVAASPRLRSNRPKR